MRASHFAVAILFLGNMTSLSAGTASPEGAQPPAEQQARQRADELVKQLSLEEKLQFIETKYPSNADPGGGGGYIQGVPRLGIPDVNIVDSATGSGSTSQDSTTFPANIALAASWSRALSYQYAVHIADQVRAQGFAMGLGGGANLAREPRGGRLFEYLGEDPVLAGELLAQRTSGTQSRKVLATVKHVVGNEQETARMGGNSQIDERTLRELYLLPFQIAVERSHPASLMCSYNRLNGIYACEDPHLLNEIVKGEWHFQGQVQSDWGATHSTANAINAGLDEEEGSDSAPPYLAGLPVRFALADHKISLERLDDMVRRKLRVMIETGVMDDPPKGGGTIDFAAANSFAQSVEEQSIVLLKNVRGELPWSPSRFKHIAVLGAHADKAVLSGGGSADTMHPVTGSFAGCGGLHFGAHEGCGWWRSPWLELQEPLVAALRAVSPGSEVRFAGNPDEHEPFRAYRQEEMDEAVALARRSDVAIVVVAQPSGEEYGDLGTLALANPGNQDELVEAVARVNPHTVVVVESGNPVLMPWKDRVAAIVEAWYPGEGGGRAIANVLFGTVNPSGKLPLTFPARDADTPTWRPDGKLVDSPVYSEGLAVGYRWYDTRHIEPLFEFGYGLSYTHFTYSGLHVGEDKEHTLNITFAVKNDGPVVGADVPQIYLHLDDPDEPPRRLVGWDKIELRPGETRRIQIAVPAQLRNIWDIGRHKWKLVPTTRVDVGASSRDVRLSKSWH